jgi:uncharacterized RDD family membrane protein YckC
MEDRYIVDTPENIAFAYDVAGIGSRFLAAIIDSLLLIVIQLAVGALLLFFSLGVDGSLVNDSIVLAIWSIVSFIFFWGYYLVFELIWNGQSPGKRWLGLRTVREGGRPITFVASAVRNLVRVIDFLPGFYGIGVVTMFIDPRSRRLGDLAGGTLVVKEGRAVTLDTLTRSVEPVLIPPRPEAAPATPLLPNLDRLTTEDYDLVQEFLRRRKDLAPQSRVGLSAELAGALKRRLGLPESGDAELFLENLVREYRVYHAARSNQVTP